MSLQTRISSLITAVGTDIKELKARTPTVLSQKTSVSDTSQPDGAVEWWTSIPSLVGKLVTINPIIAAVVQNRSELWVRVKSRDGTLSKDRLILDSDGSSNFLQAPSFSQPARARDTVYQPSVTHATLITVQVQPTGGTVGVEILIGATNNPTTHVTHLQNDTANSWRSATFIVPVGWYYKLATTNGAATLVVSEWQM